MKTSSLSTAATGADMEEREAVLYLVYMVVRLPHDMPQAQADDIKAREKAYAEELQRAGKWLHLWRVVGEYANDSVFDVGSNDELHQILSGCRCSLTWTSR